MKRIFNRFRVILANMIMPSVMHERYRRRMFEHRALSAAQQRIISKIGIELYHELAFTDRPVLLQKEDGYIQ